ncbi:hypothetical protein ACOSP7_009393 [Xanthoceras sorbifolium]
MLSYITLFTTHLIKWAWSFLISSSPSDHHNHDEEEDGDHLVSTIINLQKLEPGQGSQVEVEAIDCAVCLCDTQEEEEEIRELKCGHLFHRVCLDMWLANKHATCPLCRGPVAPPRLVTELGEEVLSFNCFSSSSSSSRERDRWWLR